MKIKLEDVFASEAIEEVNKDIEAYIYDEYYFHDLIHESPTGDYTSWGTNHWFVFKLDDKMYGFEVRITYDGEVTETPIKNGFIEVTEVFEQLTKEYVTRP